MASSLTLAVSAASDFLIWASYMVLGIGGWIVIKPIRWYLRVLPGGFIFCCGVTHLNTSWATAHGFCDATWPWAVAWRVVTVVFSVPTAMLLIAYLLGRIKT